MTLIVMMRSLSAIRADRWCFYQRCAVIECGDEIELILCCYRNAIYARRDGKVGDTNHTRQSDII